MTGVSHRFFSSWRHVTPALDWFKHQPNGHGCPCASKENLARIRFQIGVGSDALLSVTQVHGNEVVEVTHLEDVSEVKADGLFTQLPNVALAIRTADCVPILMTDKSATVVAALHAGWRSAVADIVGRG